MTFTDLFGGGGGTQYDFAPGSQVVNFAGTNNTLARTNVTSSPCILTHSHGLGYSGGEYIIYLGTSSTWVSRAYQNGNSPVFLDYGSGYYCPNGIQAYATGLGSWTIQYRLL